MCQTIKKKLTLILIFILSCVSSTSVKNVEFVEKIKLSNNQKLEIKNALEVLFKREHKYSFVMINETTTDKYVQFSISDSELMFDMPTNQLNAAEKVRAKKVMKKYKISSKQLKFHDPNDSTKIVLELETYNKKIGVDIDLAIKITEKTIVDVFKVDKEIKITIDEN